MKNWLTTIGGILMLLAPFVPRPQAANDPDYGKILMAVGGGIVGSFAKDARNGKDEQ